MAFRFQKALNIGPIRLNLSKSGVGASVGFRGLRLGRSSTGQNYVAGGKAGIRFREGLSSEPDDPEDGNGGPEEIGDEISVDSGGEFWVDIEGEEYAQEHILMVGQAMKDHGAEQPILPCRLVPVDDDENFSAMLSVRVLDQEVGVIQDEERFGALARKLLLLGQVAICFGLIIEEDGRLGLKLGIGREHVDKDHPDFAAAEGM